MDTNLAINLLEKTFKNSFNLDIFENFLRELFNSATFNIKDETPYLKKEFREYTKKVYTIGYYVDDSAESIGFYVVKLASKSTRDRARTMQRNLIAHYINKQKRDAGIVAFYEPNTDDWRFSYVTINFKFNNGVIDKNLSSAKRHSFLVGPNEPNHTCLKQFLKLLENEENITLDDIKEAFDIENVTDEFFKEYRSLYLDLTNALEEIKEKDDIIKNEFENKKIESSDFAKKLMGQIVFIYFLQKKGWLGINKKDKWNSGSRDFFKKLFNKEYIDYDNFFNDVLEPLFYEGFSHKDINKNHHFDKFNFKVPFLNGGLFEPINNYNWKKTDLILDNSIFSKILKTFNLFNFTIKEDEPLEKEVAIDPEMLGKVFEKLLKSEERKSQGAFYTPREIVHYICQQSLINYLNINTDIPITDLKDFIENSDVAIQSIIRNQKEIEQNSPNPAKIKLESSIIENSAILNTLLENVKIIDPAVGSGAFPVGMMNEIVKARQCLLLLSKVSISIYDLKKETIENSLYCVDLNYSATDITKLRFWLSLIVNEEDIENIKPLPNLDNHIMCGNSLIDSFKGVRLFDKNIIQKNKQHQTSLIIKSSEIEFKNLEKKKKEYFNEKDFEDKFKLKNEINELKWKFVNASLKESEENISNKELEKLKLLKSKPFFIYELEFSEIFNCKDPGFDIVIGNPPYIKEKTDKNAFDGVRDSPYYQGKMDLWYLFGCKAIDLVKNDGLISFIATNNWITNAGASKFRNKINKEAEFKEFIDFGNYKVFKSADIQTMIYIMQKNNQKISYNFKYGKLLNENINKDELKMFLYSNDSCDLFNKFEVNFNREENKNNYFNFIEKTKSNILDKIKENKEHLNKNEIIQGIVPNPDVINTRNINKINSLNLKKNNIKINSPVFLIPKNYLSNLTTYEKNFIKPVYEPTNCTKYSFIDNYKSELIYLTVKNINKEDIKLIPNLIKHLKPYKEIMDNRRENKNGKREYYHIHWERDEKFFNKDSKILCVRKCNIPTFVYTEKEAYVMLSFNVIKTDRFNLKFLTGLLNSKLIQFWVKYKGKMQGNNYQLDKEPLLKIPIVYNKNKEIENKITQNVDNILKILEKDIKNDIASFEHKINELVYNLYNLTPEEINIIEDSLQK